MSALCCPCYCCWCRLLHYGEGKRCPFFSRWCRRYAAYSTAVGAAFSNTARVNAARFFSAVGVGVIQPFTALVADIYYSARINADRFSTVGVGVMLLFYSCWCRRLHYGYGKRCPVVFSRWSRRYTAHFTAVDAAFSTTVIVNADDFSAVGVSVMLPILLLLMPPFTLRLG